MDEDILVFTEGVEETVQDDIYSGTVSSGNSEDTMVDSPNSDSDNILGSDIQGDPGGDLLNSWTTIYDEELGGIPVVIVDEPSVYTAVGTQNGYQLTQYYVDYFAGVLQNLSPNTDYLAFCTRENVNGSSYVEHYRLVYDIDVIDGEAQRGSYPCIDIYRSSSTTTYTVSYTTYSLQTVPSFSYGSFGLFSDLRKDVGHNETYAILFFLGFFAVYFVCHDIFDFVLERIYRK